MSDPILVHQDNDVRWIRLNRPDQRNALDPTLVTALDGAITDALEDQSTRIVAIGGEGRSFCAGADLRHLQRLADHGDDPLPYLAGIARCFDNIERAPKPVVAVLHGHAVAGGLELALACDVVIAQAGTQIGDGHVRNGLLPAGGASSRLPRKVGEPLARWLLLTGQLLPAEAFVPSGFVHAIVAPDRLHDSLVAVFDALRLPAAATQRHSKRLLNELSASAHDVTMAAEHRAFSRNWRDGHVPNALLEFANRHS
jgi:enoyl-CoA hydratase/carnithine racemase